MILIVDDDSAIRASLSLVLSRAGHKVVTASSPDEAITIVRRQTPGLILMDMNYSGAATSGDEGIELLRRIKILCPDVPVILISAWGSIPLAVEGMRLGAIDFITKPWDNRTLLSRVNTVLSLSPQGSELGETSDFDRTGIIGNSPQLNKVLDTIRRIAPTDASVLILGENGTGKELIAEAIHRNSPRRANSFIKVNLGGIPTQLFESEMFGHRKGAFTGAVADRKGRFELADKGTIFLDEIGDLDHASQVKLLRVLQEHTYEPLGDSRMRHTDIRVVSATNAPLEQMVADHTFREDLFYRLNLITITLPPLRERRADIPLLIDHFLRQTNSRSGKNIAFAASAVDTLASLPYPGNIRELRNMVERLVLVADKPVVEASDLPCELTSSASTASLESLERKAVEEAIAAADGNLSKASASLGITRQTLYRRIEKYRLKR